MRVVGWLAWARLRHRPARWILIALGVAAATVLPISAESSATVVAGQALRHGLESQPVGDRALSAIRSGLRETPQRIAELDQVARHGLGELASGPIHRQMLTRRISDGLGGSFYFAATDGLAGQVRVTEGRLPTSCTPTRCEVIAVGTAPTSLDPFGIVVVGQAVRTDPLLLAGGFDPGDGAPLLIADGVVNAAQLDYLSAFQRTYSWVTPVDLDRVNALGVDDYLARSTQANIELYGARLTLTAPDGILREQAARAEGSARRFALLGGAATALLLGFAVIGAIGLRRDHGATVDLLRRRGAGRAQVAVLLAITAAVPVILGAVLGTLAGAALAAWAGGRAGLPSWPSAVQVVGRSVPAVGVGTLAAGLVVAITLTVARAAGRRSAWRAADLTVGVGVLVAALALARGAITVESVAGGTDPLLLVLPVIVVICGGLLVGRVWPVATAAASHLFGRRSLAPRLALLGAVRSPLRPVATAAFLAAATGIVTFAGGYQATLSQGAADQASFAVPLDATVRMGQSLRQPLDIASTKDFAAAGGNAYPVIRAAGTIPVNAAQVLTPDLLGIEPDALPLIHGWRNVVGASDPGSAARLLGSANDTPAAPAPGLPVPAGTTTLAFAATGNVDDLDIAAWVRLPDGRDTGGELRHVGTTVVLDLPRPAPTGAVLFAFTISENEFALTRRQHRTGEGDHDAGALTGRISLGPPTPAATAGGSWAGWGCDNATVAAGPDRIIVDYELTGARVVVRAGQGTDPVLPVLVDPATAAAAGDGPLSVSVGAGAPITARIVGVLPRFPTARASFVVADASQLADALDARQPGTGSVGELWLAATSPDLGRALSSAPFDLLRVDLRQARQDLLLADPLARGATDLLTASALVSLLVAVVALILLVVAERRDSSAAMYAWESDGVAPGTLRWTLFLRAVAVVAVAVPGGVVIGVVLSRVTTALVRVTAVGTDPVPPLALAISPLWTVGVLAGGVGLGLVGCAVLAAAALRERLPRRPEEGLS